MILHLLSKAPARICALAALAALFALHASALHAERPHKTFHVEIEGGPVWQGKNDVEIPNDGTADRFSIPDLIGNGPFSYYRIYMSYQISKRQEFRLLFAPFTIEGNGVPSQPIRFENKSFTAGVPLNALYKFNSYRITYRYLIAKTHRLRWHIGFTAKIRDAKIELADEFQSAASTNIGFVPLLHISIQWRLSTNWSAVLDADALAAPQGRAEDFVFKLLYDITDDLFITAGYRGLEGGADAGDVYTFAWLHYAALSLGVRF